MQRTWHKNYEDVLHLVDFANIIVHSDGGYRPGLGAASAWVVGAHVNEGTTRKYELLAVHGTYYPHSIDPDVCVDSFAAETLALQEATEYLKDMLRK